MLFLPDLLELESYELITNAIPTWSVGIGERVVSCDGLFPGLPSLRPCEGHAVPPHPLLPTETPLAAAGADVNRRGLHATLFRTLTVTMVVFGGQGTLVVRVVVVVDHPTGGKRGPAPQVTGNRRPVAIHGGKAGCVACPVTIKVSNSMIYLNDLFEQQFIYFNNIYLF